MRLSHFVVAMLVGLALVMTLVWQRHQAVRYRVALNETRRQIDSVKQTNQRLACELESKTLPRHLNDKVLAFGLPLEGPEATALASRDDTSARR